MVDTILSTKYQSMFGIDNVKVISGNTLFQEVTCLSNLNIQGSVLVNESLSSMSNVNVNKNYNTSSITTNSIVNINDILTIKNNITSNSNAYINNNLYISGTGNLGSFISNDNITITGNLYISNNSTIVNDLFTPSIGALVNTKIYGDKIVIGSSNSVVTIKGTSTYVMIDNIYIEDPMYSLNINASTLSATDIGNNAGIFIATTGSTGFINTTNDGLRYLIKAPNNPNTYYILIQDNNNNLNISGTSVLNNNVTLFSKLYNTNLNSNSIIQFNDLNISGNSLINSMSVMSKLYVGSTNILKSAQFNDLLYVSGNFIGNSLNTINLSVTGVSSIGRSSLFSNLYISGNSILNNNITSNTLNINGIKLENASLSTNSNLTVSGNTQLYNNVTSGSISISNNYICSRNSSLLSNFNISSNAYINSNITIGSNTLLNINSIITCPLPEYFDNTSAKNAGLSIGSIYRTGGILKYRINDVAPILTLSGSSSVTVSSSYVDAGVGINSIYNNIIVYVTSLSVSGGSNILSSNILPSNISSYLPFGTENTYNVIYGATDPDGNVAIPVYRTINLTTKLSPTRTEAIGMTSTLYARTNNISGILGILNLGSTYVAWAYNNYHPGDPTPYSIQIYTSTDKINWTATNNTFLSGPNNNYQEITTMVSNGTVLVARVRKYNWAWDLFRSTDAINWTYVSDFGGYWNLSYGYGLFIRCGGGPMMISSNGQTWTTISGTGSNGTSAGILAYNNINTYVIAGGNSICVSTNNGSTWTTYLINTIVPQTVGTGLTDWRSCWYINGAFYVAPYFYSTTNTSWFTLKSTNGTTWTKGPDLPYFGGSLFGLGAEWTRYYSIASIPFYRSNKVYFIFSNVNVPGLGSFRVIMSTDGDNWYTSSDNFTIPSGIDYNFPVQQLNDNTITICLSGNTGTYSASNLTVNGKFSPFIIY